MAVIAITFVTLSFVSYMRGHGEVSFLAGLGSLLAGLASAGIFLK